jgi:hypothetical protein
MSTSKDVFIDTNCFIELRDLKDLRWSDLFPNEDINLLVAPVIIEELDRHKRSTRPRLRNRARAALKLIEEASYHSPMQIVLRECGPRVILRVADGFRIDWGRLPDLNPDQPDDQLVAAAVGQGRSSSLVRLQSTAELLSCDTGPRISARRIGLRAHAPPSDWYLPDEPDDKDKRIRELSRDLNEARASRPALAVSIGRKGETPSVLPLLIPVLSPLSEKAQNALRDEILRRHPKANLNTTMRIVFDDFAISESQRREYDQAWNRFSEDVGRYVETLHTRIAAQALTSSIPLFLENTGTLTIENLHVELTAEDTLIAYDRAEDAVLVGHLPPVSPPVPKGRHENLAERLVDPAFVAHLTPRPPKDPRRFYGRKSSKRAGWAWECAEFRPTNTWAAKAWFRVKGQEFTECAFTLEVSGTNMAAPSIATTRLKMGEVRAKWADPSTLDQFPDWMHSFFSDET